MTIQDLLVKKGYWTKNGVNEHRMNRAHRLFINGVIRAYAAFKYIKRDVKYGDGITKYSVFASYLAQIGAVVMGVKNIIATQTGVVQRIGKYVGTSCAAPDSQPREVSILMCDKMKEYWQQTYWGGEWGNQTIGTVDGKQNKGIPERPADKYPKRS